MGLVGPFFERKLLSLGRVGFDTNTFIYHFNQQKPYSHLTIKIFKLLEQGKIEAVTSILTWHELLSTAGVILRGSVREKYRSFVSAFPNLVFREVTWEIAERAAKIRVEYKLKAPDVIQVATALEANCKAFLTNDKALRQVKEIPVLILKDFTE